jgi:pimeloyl-ACP methyl ester carboxylesterase
MRRPKQLRAAAEESALLIPEAMPLQFPEAMPLQSRYSGIRCPVHICYGTEDQLIGTEDQLIEPEQARRLHHVIGRSDLHLVNDAGHMVTYADGGAILHAIDSVEEPLRIISSKQA